MISLCSRLFLTVLLGSGVGSTAVSFHARRKSKGIFFGCLSHWNTQLKGTLHRFHAFIFLLIDSWCWVSTQKYSVLCVCRRRSWELKVLWRFFSGERTKVVFMFVDDCIVYICIYKLAACSLTIPIKRLSPPYSFHKQLLALFSLQSTVL